jgi:hypothetical protein
MSCYLYKYMLRLIVKQRQHNQSNLYFSNFCPSFFILFVFLRLDLIFIATTSKGLVAPMTTVGPDKTEQSDFYSFEHELSIPVRFV